MKDPNKIKFEDIFDFSKKELNALEKAANDSAKAAEKLRDLFLKSNQPD